MSFSLHMSLPGVDQQYIYYAIQWSWTSSFLFTPRLLSLMQQSPALNPHFLGEKSQRQCYLSETPLKKCYIRLWKLKVTGPQVKAEQNSFQCHLFQHQCQTPSLLVHAGHRCLWFTEQLHSKKGYAPSSITAGHHDQLRRCWRNNLFPLVYPSGCPIHLFENAGRLMNRNATPCRKTHVRKEWRGRAGSK